MTVSELMGRADQAMMQSKARGGDEISVFTAGMHRRNGIRTDIELHLGTAIRNGSLTLHYQPEVDLVTGSPVRRPPTAVARRRRGSDPRRPSGDRPGPAAS